MKYKSIYATILVSLFMLSMIILPLHVYAAATIWTDKENYGPEETVTIFGSGFLVNAQVTINIEAPDLSVATIYAWTDGSGSFTAQYKLNGMEGTYTVAATDGVNTATTTFMEGPKVDAAWSDGDCSDIEAHASSLSSGKNYYVKYFDPDGNLQGTSTTHMGSSSFTDYFLLDITLPKVLGQWTVRLYESPATEKDHDHEDVDKMVWTTDSTYAAIQTSFEQGETVYFKAIGLAPTKDYRFMLDPPSGSNIYVGAWTTGVTTLTGSYDLPLTAVTGSWKLHVREQSSGEHHYVDCYFTVTPYTPPPTYWVKFNAVATSPLPDVDANTVIVSGTIGASAFTVKNSELPKTFTGVASGTWVTYTFTSLVPCTVSGKQLILDSITGPTSPFQITEDKTITGNYKIQYLLTIKTKDLPSSYSTSVYLGGSAVGTASESSPFTKWFDNGDPTGTIGVDGTISGTPGTQYVFEEWDEDSSTSNPRASETMNGPKTFTAEYKTQYYLTVISPYDTPGGEDWYNEGDTPSATLATGTVDIVPGLVQAVFTGWSGDASGTGLISNPITMNGPKTATADWKIQYYLDVVTDPSIPPPIPGADWYDYCTWVELTAPQYLPDENGVGGVRYKFSYWDVDGGSQGMGVNPIDIHMDEPHTATAHYVTQYLVSFTQTGSAVPPTVTYTANTDPLVPCSVWVLAGSQISYTYQAIVPGASGVQYVLTGVTPASPQTVNGPLTILGNYKTQYYLTVLTFPEGLQPTPTPQSGWYDNCTYVTLTAPSTAHIGNIVYNFGCWQINQKLGGAGENPITIHMDSPKTACARYCELGDPIGDVNLDGKVDMIDIATIARHYGAKLGEPNYSVGCDLNLDGKIDLRDLATAARNFS